MSALSPDDWVDPTGAPDRTTVARMLARNHAASLAAVARERTWLLAALAQGEDISKLAEDLNVTPRAIRHLLGPVDR